MRIVIEQASGMTGGWMSDDASSVAAEGAGDGSREHALASTFVMFAEALVDDYDVVDLLDRLVHGCVELLGTSAAGLLLKDRNENLAVVASSGEESRLLEICQLQSDEGPCLDCVRTGVPVICRDLSAEAARWPTFAPAALDAGFTSVLAVPMRLRERTIGGLNLFNVGPLALSADDQRLAQALADVATIGVLQQRAAQQSFLLTEQLQRALNSRVLVEQAKGVLAERHRVSVDLAFDALRRFARNHNLKLAELSQAVVRGDLDPSAFGIPTGTP
jgi:GAF domain-containing protein